MNNFVKEDFEVITSLCRSRNMLGIIILVRIRLVNDNNKVIISGWVCFRKV